VSPPNRYIYQTFEKDFFKSFDFKKESNYLLVEVVVKRKKT